MRRLLVVAFAAAPIIVTACGGRVEGTSESTLRPPSGSNEEPVEPTFDASVLRDAMADGKPTRDASKLDASGQDVRDAAIEVGPAPDGSLADGVCTHPYGHRNDFDPDCVYAGGNLSGSDLFFHPAFPDDHRGGTADNAVAHDMKIRPRDNRLLYAGGGKIWVFNADALVGPRYPMGAAATANDTVVSTPACADDGPRLLGIFPDDSVAVYRCRFGPTFLEGSTDPIPGLVSGLDALGPSRTALVIRQGGGPKIWNNGVDIPLSGYPTGNTTMLAARWDNPSNAFRIAVRGPTLPYVYRMYMVSLTGVVSAAGDYDNSPNHALFAVGALDPAGNLYAHASVSSKSRLVRLSTSGPPAIVFESSASGPLSSVSLDMGSPPFSGP